MRFSITLDDDEIKILEKRAKKNMLSLKEQIEDIVRRSCVSYKKRQKKHKPLKTDDKLVNIFSRSRRGRPRKKK